MSDPTDRSMAKVWHDIFLSVQQEDQRGHLKTTFNDPEVQRSLHDAWLATHAAAAHVEAAAQAPDPAIADAHIQAATEAHQAATTAARNAAAKQPATVSPIVVQAAADEAARASGRPLPPPAVWNLPPAHPALTSPAAKPRLPVRAITDPMPPESPSPHAARVPIATLAPTSFPSPPSLSPAHRVIAQARADQAPAVAVAIHEHAHAQARSRGLGRSPTSTPKGTTPPGMLAKLRGGAQEAARRASGDYVGISRSRQNTWIVSVFSSPDEAATWYGNVTNDPSGYDYAAYYNKLDGSSWPAPVEETLGTHEEIPVRVHVDRGPIRLPPSTAPDLETTPGPTPAVAPVTAPAVASNDEPTPVPRRIPVLPIVLGGAAAIGLLALATERRSSGAGDL